MKTKRISARLTSGAYDRLSELSVSTHLSKSEIVERMIMSKKIIIISGFGEFISALKLAERNLNQVAARLSMGQNVVVDIGEVKNIYLEILDNLQYIKRGEIDGNH